MNKLIKAGTAYYGETSILVAEARALGDRVSSAMQPWFNKLLVEGEWVTIKLLFKQ